MRNERLWTGPKQKGYDHMLHMRAWNNKHIPWKDKGAVSKSYLPCGDTGEHRSCDELPEKPNKGRLMEGGSERLLSFTGHASRQNKRRRFSR